MSDLPRPDQVEGAPHPRDTVDLFGHQGPEAEVLEAFNSDRMHSGWLITGPRGIGKATLAYRMAAFLLDQPVGGGLFGDPPPATTLTTDPEGPTRRQISAESHPGLFVLHRELNDRGTAYSADIRVSQIRKLKSFFHLSNAEGGRRVVIIDAADELNRSAANAVLKELEEPPARTTILLVAHQPSRLLPTIRSRCRTLRLSPLGAEDMSAALAQAGHHAEATESLTALSEGSVGDALTLLQSDGLSLYGSLIELFESLPNLDRQAATALANTASARAADTRFDQIAELTARFLSRTARAGLMGPPAVQAAPNEARLLARLSPHDVAARNWAALTTDLSERLTKGRAVNIDPAALLLDAFIQIDSTARTHL